LSVFSLLNNTTTSCQSSVSRHCCLNSMNRFGICILELSGSAHFIM